MNEKFEISKLDAARRQLRTAIRMLFDGDDTVAIHTLVGAASVIISNLVQQKHPEKSWDKFAQDANNLTPQEYFQVMRKPQNFLKHAASDPDEKFEFNPIETDAVTFWAVMNSTNLYPLSIEESVFQLWYLASHAPTLERSIKPYDIALQLFGDLRLLTRPEQLAAGKRVLSEELSKIE